MAKTTVRAPGLTPTTQGDILVASAGGIWTNLPAGVSGQVLQTLGAGSPPAWSYGTLAGSAYAKYQTYPGALSTTTPADDSVPTASEGNEIVSVSYTVKSASSAIIVGAVFFGGVANASNVVAACLHKGSAAASAVVASSTASTSLPLTIPIIYSEASGATGAVTWSLRVGSAVGAIYPNGISSGRLYGGAACCSIWVQEWI